MQVNLVTILRDAYICSPKCILCHCMLINVVTLHEITWEGPRNAPDRTVHVRSEHTELAWLTRPFHRIPEVSGMSNQLDKVWDPPSQLLLMQIAAPLMKGSREGKQHTSPLPSMCTWALRKPGRIQTKTDPAAQNSSAIRSCGEALIRMYPFSSLTKRRRCGGKQGAVKQNQPVQTRYWSEKCLILWEPGQSRTCSLYLSWPQAQPVTL